MTVIVNEIAVREAMQGAQAGMRLRGVGMSGGQCGAEREMCAAVITVSGGSPRLGVEKHEARRGYSMTTKLWDEERSASVHIHERHEHVLTP